MMIEVISKKERFMVTPILETERLILRPFQGDFILMS